MYKDVVMVVVAIASHRILPCSPRQVTNPR